MREILILLYLVFMMVFIIRGLIEDRKLKTIRKRRELDKLEYEKFLQQEHQKKINLAEQQYQMWRTIEEPTHRNERNYPVDWNYRRLFKLREYNFICQQCGKATPEERKIFISDGLLLNLNYVRARLHVHHVKPLSIGGDNNLSNLTVLCEECHEKQHKHMLERKLTFFEKKQRRARSQVMINQWTSEIDKIKKFLKPFEV